jgi:hypothetical protein
MQDRFRMNISSPGLWLVSGLLSALLAANAWAAPEKEAPGQTVDSGSFGVFMNGKRVATETFSIHQGSSGSSVISRFKTEAGPDPAEQSSELQLTAGGELKSYEWKEIRPGQSQATVLPGQDFLTERYTSGPSDKSHEQPFLLPASTSILDDYFFIQREVLAWKYLATSCKQDKGGVSCPLKEKTQLGTLNAHARASGLVNLQFSGREKISLHGVEHELIRLDLKSESSDWTLWLDDQLKLQRIVDSANTTEVVRD